MKPLEARIAHILSLSTVDYPGKASVVVFFQGCNYRCPFCFNFELVDKDKGAAKSLRSVETELKKHISLVDAVVFTGGEPLLQPDAVAGLATFLKKKKKRVKIDTNGSFPEALGKLVRKKLVDFVALDFKSDAESYQSAIGVPDETAYSNLKKSIEICRGRVPFEIRVTVVPGLNDSREIIEKIAENSQGAEWLVLQQFDPSRGTLGKLSVPATPKEKLIELAGVSKKYIKTKLRMLDEGERDV